MRGWSCDLSQVADPASYGQTDQCVVKQTHQTYQTPRLMVQETSVRLVRLVRFLYTAFPVMSYTHCMMYQCHLPKSDGG